MPTRQDGVENRDKVYCKVITTCKKKRGPKWHPKAGGRGGVLPYMGYRDIYAAVKGNGFQAVCSRIEYVTERLGLE